MLLDLSGTRIMYLHELLHFGEIFSKYITTGDLFRNSFCFLQRYCTEKALRMATRKITVTQRHLFWSRHETILIVQTFLKAFVSYYFVIFCPLLQTLHPLYFSCFVLWAWRHYSFQERSITNGRQFGGLQSPSVSIAVTFMCDTACHKINVTCNIVLNVRLGEFLCLGCMYDQSGTCPKELVYLGLRNSLFLRQEGLSKPAQVWFLPWKMWEDSREQLCYISWHCIVYQLLLKKNFVNIYFSAQL